MTQAPEVTRDSLVSDSDVNARARAEAEHPETSRGLLAPRPVDVLVLEPAPNPRGGPVPETAPGFVFPASEAVEIQVSEFAGTPMPAAGGTPMPPPRKYAQILEGTEVCRRLVLVARTA
ncbi:hypothetical protein [Streptomyces sp. NPDC087856]|uniref:hypothetical protein n=1 Tax=Streptomyces sp. NPDC087856 TaxID=3365811 RepID=UPI0037F70A31